MITIKEEFLDSPKWRRAVELGGSDAIVMWLAMKGYAATNPTDGFVPDEDIERLPGAPKNARKALKALLECGRRHRDGSRGAGLVDAVDNGWELHDYLDHAPSSAEVAERRQGAKARKDRWREKNAQGTRSRTRSDTLPGLGGNETGTEPPAGACARVPSPAQPSPEEIQEQSSSQDPKDDGGAPPPDDDDDESQKGPNFVPCPTDLVLAPGKRGSLETSGIPTYAIDATTTKYRSYYAGSTQRRTLEQWHRGLVSAISSDWNDPKRRPKPPGGASSSIDDLVARSERIAAEEARLAEETGA